MGPRTLNALQTPKAEVPWALLFAGGSDFFSGRKSFRHSNPHFPFGNHKSLTFVSRTLIAEGTRTFRLQEAVVHPSLTGSFPFPFFFLPIPVLSLD